LHLAGGPRHTNRLLTLVDFLDGEDSSLRGLVLLLANLSFRIAREIPSGVGFSGTVNTYGERQLQIDTWANDLLTRELTKSGLVSQVASEELEKPLKAPRGEYSITLDPVDGSSNVISNNPMGTIVGIYHDRLRLPAKGRNLLASLYFLYGPYMQLVIALGNGVHTFTASARGRDGPSRFVSDGEPRRFPSEAEVYGVGGLRAKWPTAIREFVEMMDNRLLQVRYGGSLVGDFNQILNKGGFFGYPELVDAPNGKYRLQFESNPIAFITEKAGGKASTGRSPILDVEPTSIDQRVPTYLGNAELVSQLEELLYKGKESPSGVRPKE
jgi:fructose-1,6-bisphosphatase I